MKLTAVNAAIRPENHVLAIKKDKDAISSRPISSQTHQASTPCKSKHEAKNQKKRFQRYINANAIML
jgi:hypothetical protein